MAEDRFKKAKQEAAQRRESARIRRESYGGETEGSAEKRAESGKEFLCRTCRRWRPRRKFLYEYNNEERLATNCEGCRENYREMRRKPWERR